MDSRAAQGSEGESFAGLLLRYRGRTGLSQRDLAERVGTTRRSIQDWEAGAYYPNAERLQALIQVLLESGGLSAGRERHEANAMWAAVLREAPRMHTPLDQVWLDELLAQPTQVLAEPAREVVVAGPAPFVERTHDWGEAPDILAFVGRAEELATLREWAVVERCRVALVLGMGGIGKSALASRLAQDAATTFERVYWRSLRDALPPAEWLASAIDFLSAHHVVPPDGESPRLAALLQLLRERPSLLVLDNFETVLEPGQPEGRYREGFTSYGRLLRAVGETGHQSCLVVTSREAPPEVAVLDGGALRRLQLGGLGVTEGRTLLGDKHLSGNEAAWTELIARFGGNGLALKVVGERIRDVFEGDIAAFLDQAGSNSIFGGVRKLLSEQIERSSTLEQKLLRVLAVEREPVGIAALLGHMGSHTNRAAIVGAIEALRRRSLVERAGTTGIAAFTLQSVVLEYVTDRLVGEVTNEIGSRQPVVLVEQPLIQAHAKDYVRQTQERLVGEPILQQLRTDHGQDGADQRLMTLLDSWRHRPHVEQGYGPGNVINLLRLGRGHLRAVDLSALSIRQVYLAGVETQDASLVSADLSEAVLADAFNFPVSVTLSDDGTALVIGTAAGEIWLWRVADRTPLFAVQGHSGPVHAVALSTDGRLLVSAGEDGTVRLWDSANEGRPLSTLRGHTGQVHGVALSADRQLLASGSYDGTVRLWALPLSIDGDMSHPGTTASSAGAANDSWTFATLEHGGSPVYGVALSADGRLLASGGSDGMVRLWEPLIDESHRDHSASPDQEAPGRVPHEPRRRWRLISTLQAHATGVWDVCLSADGRLLATGGVDGTVRLWDTASDGRLLATFQGDARPAYGVALSRDGRQLANGGIDGTIRLWDTTSCRAVATIRGQTGAAVGAALSADGHLLATCSENGAVRVWEAPQARLLATLQGLTNGICSVALSPDGSLVASGGQDGGVQVWEAAGCAQPAAGPPVGAGLLARWHSSSGLVFSVAISSDGRLLATGNLDRTVQLVEVSSARVMATLRGHTGAICGLAFASDGRLLATGSFDGTLRLWEVADGQLRATLEGHTGAVCAVALGADGRLLASGSFDGTVRLWDVASGLPLGILRGHRGVVHSVALSADGQLLASGGGDGTVRIWETHFANSGVTTAKPLRIVEAHTGGVRSVALSGDGKLLASGGQDASVRLWDPGAGSLLARLQGHTGAVWGVALTTDGHLLASGGLDGTVRLWDPRTGATLRILRTDRCYERMDITGVSGVTAAQHWGLLTLGAVDREVISS